MKFLFRVAFILFLSIFLRINHSLAEGTNQRLFQGIEFLSGFSHAKLRENPDTKVNYNTIPILVGFDFNLKPLTAKIGFNPASLVQFQLEPYILYIFEPDNNIEIGNSFAFKFGILPEAYKFQPYLKLGAGLLYTTQHIRQQSTQFNFNEYLGAGAHYFFKKSTAFTLEGRFRHVSNADIKLPNSGVNSYFILAGIAYRF